MKKGILILSAIVLVTVHGIQSQNVCYEPLGCFTNDPPFTSALLRQPLLPQGRDVIHVAYSLYLRHEADDATEPNTDFHSVNVSGPHDLSYDSRIGRKWRQLLTVTKQTKIIIHDYDDTGTNSWVFAMVEELLKRDDCQVITVDWASPDGAGGYYQATANARLVGAEIALLLKKIRESKNSFEFEFVHLIGHGMGAHIASYVGETLKIDDLACSTQESSEEDEDSSSWWELPSWLRSRREREQPPRKSCPKKPQIGHITGLDPSGLWFEGVGAGARLDASDAIFVDVIHTDVIKQLTSYFGHGIVRASGNVDIYPNGGHSQPGCEEGTTGIENLTYPNATEPRHQMGCNHLRSIVYYLSSIDSSSCSMTSFPCTSWADFLDGQCHSCSPSLGQEGHASSSWLTYLGVTRKRRTSDPKCLEIGPNIITSWLDYQRRAEAEEIEVQNIKAFLKTGPSPPYCLKYIHIVVELEEASSEGTLSFQFTDQRNSKTEMMNVGRVSNWGSTSLPTYIVTVPNWFGTVTKVTVLWEMGVTTSWWPGNWGGSRSGAKRELKLPLKKIRISQPPADEVSMFCSARKKLRSRKESRFIPCGTASPDYADEGQ